MTPEDQKREDIMNEFAGLMPMLRTRLNITQQQLGQKVGTTRQTIIFIESKKRKMTWSMFLSLAFIFFLDSRTRPFLLASGVFNEELGNMLFGDTAMLSKASAMLEADKPMLTKAQEMINVLKKKDDNE